MATKTHEHYMALAIREAERGLYTTRPNPRVGCVLVKDDQIISKGFHRQTGQRHAEADAIHNATQDITGCTAYVTLEPCSFKGRTPSCAETLIEKGVTRVVYAGEDPHPGNRGKGFDKLRAAGVEIVGPVLEASAQALNPGHFKKFIHGMPFVRLKIAQSLDGRTALANGASQWITGTEARRDVQKLRARSCAVVTGVDSVIADDPQMNVREGELANEFAALAASIHRPIVVLDSHGRMPRSAKLVANESLIVASLKERGDLPVKQAVIDANEQNQIDLSQLLQWLVKHEDCSEVLFECGPRLAASLIDSQLVDELVVYIAPKILGDDGQGSVHLSGLQAMTDVPEFSLFEQRRMGNDIRLTLRRN